MAYRSRPCWLGYRPELNNSFSSSARLPSPAVSCVSGIPRNGYPMQRTNTPMSASLHSLRPAWNHSAASSRGPPKSPTESTGPHYYDYSESFLEQDCVSPTDDPSMVSLPFNMDQTIMEDEVVPKRRQAQSPFGTMPGSFFRPLELPTSHSCRLSEHSKQSKHSYTGVIPPRKSSLTTTTEHRRSASSTSTSLKVRQPSMHPQYSRECPVIFADELQQVMRRVVTAEREHSEGRLKDEKDNPRASTTSRRTSHSAHASAFFPNACRSPRDLTMLAARVHSPSFDEKPSIAGLLEYGIPRPENDKRKVQSDIQQVRGQWQLPSFSFRPLSFGSSSPELKERPKTSGDIRAKTSPEILSPMPERPMSSQSRRRFSRILEISDDQVTDPSIPPSAPQLSSRLEAVEEHPDLQALERSLLSPSEFESRLNGPDPQNHFQGYMAEQASPIAHGDASYITMQERSTIDSLLDQHIECLGLDESGVEGEIIQMKAPLERIDSFHSDAALKSSEQSMVRAPGTIQQISSQRGCRPTTSGSTVQHSSLTSAERRQLIPRRLFASLDARLPPGAMLEDIRSIPTSHLTSTPAGLQQRLSGWQTLPSTSELVTSDSARSTTKASLTSGDMADVDTDPPITRFKIRRVSELSFSPAVENSLHGTPVLQLHRRSKSDLLARQVTHQRRRARILLKTKRKSQSLGELVSLDSNDQVTEDAAQSDDWTTEDSPEEPSKISPLSEHVNLSADSVAVQPPTELSAEASVLNPTPVPQRWTSMLAAMPSPVKKSIEIVRKTSVGTVQSHKSHTSLTQPIKSTRYSSEVPRLGAVPQLATPEFGPPLTCSNLNLSLRLPESLQIHRPPLRQVQSFFSDDSTSALAHKKPNTLRKRFDLHSFRSGVTKSTGLIGTRHSSTQRGSSTFHASESYRVVKHESGECRPDVMGDTVAMSNFAYKKKNVLGRFKEWWKRQCMGKTLDLVRSKSGRNVRQAAWA